jgi:hypothetical protein
MKKTFALVVLIVTPTVAFAQGTVTFENGTAGLVKQWTSYYDSALTPVPVGGGYVELITAQHGFALENPLGVYLGSSGFMPQYSCLACFLAANPGWMATWPPTSINVAPGLFYGGDVIISFIPREANADYFVIGWTGPYNSYDAAYAGGAFLGMSAIATTTTGDLLATPPGIPASLSTTFAGITLAPVIPEPSTFALVGLGLAALQVFRRRN